MDILLAILYIVTGLAAIANILHEAFSGLEPDR